MSSLVYYGGSFLPPHLGHHQILKALLQDSWADGVFLVPTNLNPLKPRGPGSMEMDLNDRKALVELWVRGLERELPYAHFSKLKVHWAELERDPREASYTIDTLKELQQKFSGPHHWHLAVGGDVPRDFPKWKDVEKLFSSLSSVWLFHRQGESEPLAQLSPTLQNLTSFRSMPQGIQSVSGTRIREQLSRDSREVTLSPTQLLPSVRERIISSIESGRLRLL